MRLVGRDAELAALCAHLTAPGVRLAVVVAEPGAGKTTLVKALAETLTGTVLVARPLETEASLGFAGLSDLLASFDEHAYDRLPGPQRAAIRGALLLDDPTAAEPRAVAAALHTLLLSHQPLTILVDDGQWLDAASATALAQALRRVDPSLPIHLVAASRPSGRATAEWVPDWPQAQVALGPMSDPELYDVVHEHLGVRLPPADLRRVAAAAKGNPLHALEFARHRAGAGVSFEAVLGERLLSLPRPTRTVLAAAALARRPTLQVLRGALGEDSQGVIDGAMETAIQARLVNVRDTVEFLHPLYREGAAAAVSSEERADLHRRLADAEQNPEARVRHRALASSERDETLAHDLAGAARDAWGRAAWSSAQELMKLAIERGIDPGAADTRRLELGRWYRSNGALADAERLLRPLWEAGGPLRDEAGVELLVLFDLQDDRAAGFAVASELDLEAMTPELHAAAVSIGYLPYALGREADFLAYDRRAWERLAAVPDRPGLSRLKADMLGAMCTSLFRAGEDADELLELAVEYDAREPGGILERGPLIERGHQLLNRQRFEDARLAYGEMLERARAFGDDVSIPILCSHAGHLAYRAGWWDAIDELHDEGRRVAAASGLEWYRTVVELTDLRLLGMREGELDRAVDRIEEMLATSELSYFAVCIALATLAELLLARGQADEAFAASERLREQAARYGWSDPADLPSHVPYLESAIATGRLDEAGAELQRVRARCGRYPALLAQLGRFDVALLAARGQTDAAVAAVPAMLAGLDELPEGFQAQPFERAAALLTAGRVYRRGRRKSEAQEALTGALRIYESLPCPPYVALAREELARIGLRSTTPAVLTGTELMVARLAAEGLRNSEIADRAFLAVKTVEAVLTRVYRKLDLRSRAELGRALERRGLERP